MVELILHRYPIKTTHDLDFLPFSWFFHVGIIQFLMGENIWGVIYVTCAICTFLTALFIGEWYAIPVPQRAEDSANLFSN